MTEQKCIFTGEPTNMLTKGRFPCSREGRTILRERQQIMAEVAMEEYNKMLTELNEKLSERAKEQGTVHVDLELKTDLKEFTPSVREVIAEQVKQNKQSEESE